MEDTRNAMFGSGVPALILENKRNRSRSFAVAYTVLNVRLSRLHVARLIKSHLVSRPSFSSSPSVSLPPLLGSTGGAVLALGRVSGSSLGHTRGEYLGFLGTSVKDFSS